RVSSSCREAAAPDRRPARAERSRRPGARRRLPPLGLGALARGAAGGRPAPAGAPGPARRTRRPARGRPRRRRPREAPADRLPRLLRLPRAARRARARRRLRQGRARLRPRRARRGRRHRHRPEPRGAAVRAVALPLGAAGARRGRRARVDAAGAVRRRRALERAGARRRATRAPAPAGRARAPGSAPAPRARARARLDDRAPARARASLLQRPDARDGVQPRAARRRARVRRPADRRARRALGRAVGRRGAGPGPVSLARVAGAAPWPLRLRVRRARNAWTAARHTLRQASRWRELAATPPRAGELAVCYGLERMPGPDEIVYGGAVKFQLLHEAFPNAPRDFNVLYLGSSSLTLDSRPLVRLARRRGAAFVWNQNGVAYPGWYGPGYELVNAPR